MSTDFPSGRLLIVEAVIAIIGIAILAWVIWSTL
jgi:hypothetical protein